MRSPLLVIFTTVFVDLVGFGIVIPLIGLYGKHFGANGFELAILGAIYSVMQFVFNPFWGGLSDRYGRRPILLISLVGSSISYFLFAFSNQLWILIFSRAFAGIFAANISAAQAYIADITTLKDRAKGMGLLGAAFGIGFTLGPPLGGIAAAELGLWAPGVIAGTICSLNALLAFFRLKESLPPEKRLQVARPYQPLNLDALRRASRSPALVLYLIVFTLSTFAFSNMEQTFSLLLQLRLGLDTALAGYQTGVVLMVAGLLGALVQGGLIRKLSPRFGEIRLMKAGLFFFVISMAAFPLIGTYPGFFFLMVPMALGSGLLNPSVSTLISKAAAENEQGTVFGLNQGLGALARAFGPFCGLLLFDVSSFYPFWLAAFISAGLLVLVIARSPRAAIR